MLLCTLSKKIGQQFMAQLVEHWAQDCEVQGSITFGGTFLCGLDEC